MTDLLTYDSFGLSVDAIGPEQGLSPTDLVTLQDRLERARAAVLATHELEELAFLGLARQDISPIIAWADEAAERYTDQVVLGIGGSSLGALAILDSALGFEPRVRTHFSENIDPVSFSLLLERLPLETTALIVITKSGSTVETMGKFWIAYDRMVAALGEEKAAKNVVAITDPERGGLRALVQTHGFQSFPVPSNVGGRFSVLTPVGLVPLALAGYDVRGLLAGAASAADGFESQEVGDSVVLQCAAHQYALWERGVNQYVMMPYSDALLGMADWFRQLWAESLGKRVNRQGEEVRTGITPIKALGVIDQHSQVQLYVEGPRDKHVSFLRVVDFGVDLTIPSREGLPESLSHLPGKGLAEIMDAELRGTRLALQDAGQPTSVWTFRDTGAACVGAFIMVWECVTAVMGELLDIDAFDQPGVELGKVIAHGLLGREDHAEVAQRMVERESARQADALLAIRE